MVVVQTNSMMKYALELVSSGSYSNLLDNFLCSFQAACGLQIRSLIDVTSEALVDMIIGKTPEEIHKMFTRSHS
ncbi:E3 ubiquitin ligase complex SCF subunit sconC [Tanacetum coccineum]